MTDPRIIRCAAAGAAIAAEPFVMPDGSKVYANVCAGHAIQIARACILKWLEQALTPEGLQALIDSVPWSDASFGNYSALAKDIHAAMCEQAKKELGG